MFVSQQKVLYTLAPSLLLWNIDQSYLRGCLLSTSLQEIFFFFPEVQPHGL